MTNACLTLLQLNDLHGYVEPHPEVFAGAGRFEYRTTGGLARIASVFDQARRDNPGGVLALDNGDTLHGTWLAVQSRGAALIPLLEPLQLDAMTAHWEFAYGPARFKELAASLRYPVLAINCYDSETGRLVFEPSRVFERGGFRVGVVGIAATIVDKSMPKSYSEGVRFSLGNEELPQHIDRLRAADRVDLVVVLSHLGFPQDVKLAAQVPGIDVIVSGHTHNRLYEPVRVGRTTIFQSGCHGSFVGRLDIRRDGSGFSTEHGLIEIGDSIAERPDVKDAVDLALAPHRNFLREVVGRTPRALDRATSLESTMDNVLLDAIAQAGGTDIAFSNGWRYGAPILPGEVTMEHLWNVVPTNAAVSTVELTGDELLAMLEKNLERTYAADPYKQMGGFVKRCRGMNLYMKAENPAGHRIDTLLVAGEKVRGDRLYRASFLGEQGVPAKFGSNRKRLEIQAIEALRQQFAKPLGTSGTLRGSVVPV